MIEPVGAALLVTVSNKFIINNPNVWVHICGCWHPHHEESHENATSSTTSVNNIEVHMHHFEQTFFWLVLIHGP